MRSWWGTTSSSTSPAAQAAGLHGVLVRTGKFRTVDLDDPRIHPTEVIDSVVDLPGLLGL